MTQRPRWRYELADKFAEEVNYDVNKLDFDKDEDNTVVKLTTYLCKRKVEKKLRLLRKEFPYIHEAFELDLTRGNGFSEVWALEALALGGMPAKDIVEYIFYDDPKFVNTFLSCFYDVRDKEIKKRYINNIRLACESDKNVCKYDYSWKKRAALDGLDCFIKTVLNRTLMGQPEIDLLDDDADKLTAINGQWALERRDLLQDKIRSEAEIIMEKQDIDIHMANRNNKQNTDSVGNTGKELINVLDLINNQIELSQPNENVSPIEPRLTKKRENENGKNVKKQ